MRRQADARLKTRDPGIVPALRLTPHSNPFTSLATNILISNLQTRSIGFLNYSFRSRRDIAAAINRQHAQLSPDRSSHVCRPGSFFLRVQRLALSFLVKNAPVPNEVHAQNCLASVSPITSTNHQDRQTVRKARKWRNQESRQFLPGGNGFSTASLR